MYFITGEDPKIVRTFALDYIERAVSETSLGDKPFTIVIRKQYSQGQQSSAFGYTRSLLSRRVKRMTFKYLESFDKLITYLLGIIGNEQSYNVENILIEDIHEYTGNNIIQVGMEFIMLVNILSKVSSALSIGSKFKQFGCLIISACGDQSYLSKIRSFVEKTLENHIIEIQMAPQELSYENQLARRQSEGTNSYILVKDGQKYDGQSMQSLRQIQKFYARKNNL